MESSIDSSITTAVKLLGKWRTDGRQIRCRLLNNWEGWSIDGIDLFESIEVVEECLTVRFQTWSVSLALAKIEEVSITDSRTPASLSRIWDLRELVD